MTTEYYHDLSLLGGVAPSASEQAALKHFEHTLKMCVAGWQRGDHIVVLPLNIRDRYGDLVVQLLQRILTDQIGEHVGVTVADDINGPKTFIQMPKLDMSQPPVEAQSVTSHQTEVSDQPSAKADAAVIGTKKAPRPMNCWLMFRDAMHKTLKAQNPDFSVQQICKCTPIHDAVQRPC
jgi:transcription factor SOX7/8/10/18 (SOX group E/F)